MQSEKATVQVLTDVECRRLLSGARIGRVGFTAQALPAIQPVNFALHEGLVVIPAEVDGTLATGCRGAVVAFEADGQDRETGVAWSVTVVGPSRVVTDPADVADLDRLGLETWSSSSRRCYITVPLRMVSGRRVTIAPAPAPALAVHSLSA